MKKRAFIKYTEYGKIIPGSMIVTQGSFPSKEGRAKWYEVSMNKCCSFGPFNLEQFLSRMNSCYTQVTSLVPNIVYFSDYPNNFDGPYNNISEGCSDMYDDGNFYNTNLTQLYENAKEDNVNASLSIPYTHLQDDGSYECDYTNPPMNGAIVDGSSYFGTGSQYFTNMYPGMFMIAANGINVTEFSITGNIGSDGNGVDAVYIVTAHPGWTAYVKTNYDLDGSDPSINHIILVYGDVSGATQLYDNTAEYDDHCVQGLGTQNTTIITAVVATEPSTPPLSEAQALAIADKILDVYNDGTCVTPPAFRMLFSDISAVDAIVGDSSNVSDWNSYFDLPTYGSPFTSAEVVGNEVRLFGGSNIIIKEMLFDQADLLGTYLLEVDDQAGSIVEVEYDGFGYDNYNGCQNTTLLNLPNLTIAGDYAFAAFGFAAASITELNLPSLTSAGFSCFSSFGGDVTSINLPAATVIGSYCFTGCTAITNIYLPSCVNLGATVGNDVVFGAIAGNIITLTVPSALMTCDAGNPDGDIVYLQANNTVTIVTT